MLWSNHVGNYSLKVKINITVNGERSNFSKFSFLCHLKNHNSNDVNLKWQLKWKSRLDVQSSFMHCSCLYLTVCYHNQARFHQYLPNGTFFSCKVWHGLWENYTLSCDNKIFKSLENKLKKIRLDSNVLVSKDTMTSVGTIYCLQ